MRKNRRMRSGRDGIGFVVAFSGGKDSTALTLRLHELGESFSLIHTATGNELPDVRNHIERIVRHTGADLIDLHAPTLAELIERQGALPNFRMRWCTRMIKIAPCARWIDENPDTILAVGLRADEIGRIGGVFKSAEEIVYPLREWNWGEKEVVDYCIRQGFEPPPRTDCAVCFYQTLGEWHSLWRNHPEMYAQGEAWEKSIGHTFRSPKRDTQPAALYDLRTKFESGYAPKKRARKTMCRICEAM